MLFELFNYSAVKALLAPVWLSPAPHIGGCNSVDPEINDKTTTTNPRLFQRSNRDPSLQNVLPHKNLTLV
jgi:hypothetical protein